MRIERITMNNYGTGAQIGDFNGEIVITNYSGKNTKGDKNSMRRTFITQNAKEIYNYGDIHGDVTLDTDGEVLVNGIPIEKYVEKQTHKAKEKERQAKERAREALKRALEELEDSE